MSEPRDPAPDPYLDSGAYAADALPASDVAAFEAAMHADPALQEEVDGLQATAARLGMAASEPAPAGLRDRVMAEVDRTRQDAPAAPEADVVVLRPRHSATAFRLLGVAAALLAVAAIGLSAWVIGLRHQNEALVGAGAEVTRVLTASDARTVSGPVDGQSGRAAVVVSPSLGAAVFVADSLSSAPIGETYQLWLIGADGSARSAGVFAPGSDGGAAVPLSGSLDDAALVGMTLEPAGGSTQPTSTPVLAIPLA